MVYNAIMVVCISGLSGKIPSNFIDAFFCHVTKWHTVHYGNYFNSQIYQIYGYQISFSTTISLFSTTVGELTSACHRVTNISFIIFTIYLYFQNYGQHYFIDGNHIDIYAFIPDYHFKVIQVISTDPIPSVWCVSIYTHTHKLHT